MERYLNTYVITQKATTITISLIQHFSHTVFIGEIQKSILTWFLLPISSKFLVLAVLWPPGKGPTGTLTSATSSSSGESFLRIGLGDGGANFLSFFLFFFSFFLAAGLWSSPVHRKAKHDWSVDICHLTHTESRDLKFHLSYHPARRVQIVISSSFCQRENKHNTSYMQKHLIYTNTDEIIKVKPWSVLKRGYKSTVLVKLK